MIDVIERFINEYPRKDCAKCKFLSVIGLTSTGEATEWDCNLQYLAGSRRNKVPKQFNSNCNSEELIPFCTIDQWIEVMRKELESIKMELGYRAKIIHEVHKANKAVEHFCEERWNH